MNRIRRLKKSDYREHFTDNRYFSRTQIHHRSTTVFRIMTQADSKLLFPDCYDAIKYESYNMTHITTLSVDLGTVKMSA